MKTITTIQELRTWRAQLHGLDKRVVLVPTMGALHRGHLQLIDAGASRGEEVVVSVFVNPRQFAPTDDLDRYPRDLAGDAALAAQHGATLLFAPSVVEMYPSAESTTVQPTPASVRWEADARPGHFAGVLTVVAKLFNLIQPDLAVFGQKDIQQLILVRQMIADLNFPVEAVSVATVRDHDGLALSSRNVYLSCTERTAAVAIPNALRAASVAWRGGLRSADRLSQVLFNTINNEPTLFLEYIAIVEPTKMEPVTEATPGCIIAVAVRVGKTRLIDNTILGMEAC